MPFTHAPVPGAFVGSFIFDAAWKLVLHTTEGDTLSGALRTYAMTGLIPHVTAAPKERRAVQHIDLDQSGSALRHLSGTVETNRARAIQVEIVGRAATLDGTLTDGDRRWLLGEVIGPLCAEKNIPLEALEFHPYPPPPPQQLDGTEPWRLSPRAWLAFNGICGHQHVPGNVHGDPGTLTLFGQEEDLTPEQDARLAKIEAMLVGPLGIDRLSDIADWVKATPDNIVGRLLAVLLDVDEAALARELAPLLAQNLTKLADTDLDRIAKAVADENARRLAS